MTDSAAITKGSQEYRDALIATQAVVSDHEPLGFVDPPSVGQKQLSAVLKQNNFLIQISTTILRKLTELEDRIQAIEQQAKRIETGKTKVELPDDAVQQLVQSLQGTALAGKTKEKGKEIAPIQARKNPYTIYKEEQERLKKK